MAKFTVECPKCKTMNMVATGLFAKKEVPCARCHTLIKIAAARNVIKKCPNCGKMLFRRKGKNPGLVCADRACGYFKEEIIPETDTPDLPPPPTDADVPF